MAQGGNVNITIIDGGSASIIVPGASTQLVIGCSSLGTVGQMIATRNASTLQSSLGAGPLVEAAALACLAGGTVIAVKATTATPGTSTAIVSSVAGTSVPTIQGAVALTSTTGVGVSPIVVTSAVAHGYATGDVVTISGVTGNTNANATNAITVLSSTTFSLPTTVVANGTGASGSSLKSPIDTYYVQVNVVTGGTIGTGPVNIQVSLDAGRNFGPVIALGTANSYAIPGAGITIKFAAGTLLTGDLFRFSTTEPTWNTAGIQAAINSFAASAYGIIGVGSTHIVGVTNGANATTIQGYLDTVANNYVFTRTFMTARDVTAPVAWGGAGETEAAWMTSIQTDFSATQARRICCGAAHWNMPTGFPNPSATGAPSLRRPIAWAAAARYVTVPPQRHIGRVRDGSVSQIVVNPTSDPQDGFIYHDERNTPGLDYLIAQTGSSRLMTSMTRTGAPGVYITNPLTLAPLGSDFFLMPLGTVMDLFASIVHQVGQLSIDDDVRLNTNGTIFDNDARNIEAAIAGAVNSQLFAAKMISGPVSAGPSSQPNGAAIIVDRTTNVKATNNVAISGQILSRGYVLSMTVNLSFQNPNAAV